MSDYSFSLPVDFKEYEWEVTAKGFYSEAKIEFSGKSYSINFYDPVRLAQEIESEVPRNVVFFEPNLVIVHSVTGESMRRAAELLVGSGRMSLLVPSN